jgi:DNA-binding SARP family transcriptional activator
LVRRSELDIHWIKANVFGVPRIKIDDQPIGDDAWKTVKAKKLLFYLLLRRGERTSGDLLVEKLWPKASPGKGSDSLRKAVQHIRGITKTHSGRSAELVRLL